MRKCFILLCTMLMFAFITEAQNNQNNKQRKNVVKTIELTKADFLSKVANYEKNPNKWEYLGDKPALIDFYASWCGPCKMLVPVLEELAQEYGDTLYIYKINVDKEQELASAFGVRSIPTLVFIPMKSEPRVSQGAMPKSDLRRSIDSYLLLKDKKR